jgi:hypothetical protein
MKRLLFIVIFATLLSCKESVSFIDTQMTCTVDSVMYHSIGSDNTLQVTPYWKAHMKELNVWMTTYQIINVGDTVPVIVRTVNKNKQ